MVSENEVSKVIVAMAIGLIIGGGMTYLLMPKDRVIEVPMIIEMPDEQQQLVEIRDEVTSLTTLVYGAIAASLVAALAAIVSLMQVSRRRFDSI